MKLQERTVRTQVDYREMRASQLFAECSRPENRAAWSEFLSRYHSTIAGVVAKTLAASGRASRDAVEDMVQEVYARLCEDNCRRLRAFEERSENSDYGYLKVVTIRIGQDKLRHDRLGARDTSAMLPLDEVHEIASSNAADADRAILIRQLADAVQSADSARDWLIFDLFYHVGLTSADLADYPSVDLGPKGVESVIHRMTRTVRDRLGSGPPKGKLAGGALS